MPLPEQIDLPPIGYKELEIPRALRFVARQMKVTTESIYTWRSIGRRNPHTREQIYCQFTRLPSGEWGITQSQLDDFIRRLNEKP